MDPWHSTRNPSTNSRASWRKPCRPGLAALGDDLEQNFKAVLQGGLAKLDLVTRQEFDIQAAVLRRSRERLEELEKRIAALEKAPPRK